MAELFDPYYNWLGIPPEEQPPSHYRLLGLRDYEANAVVIENAAEQRMGFLHTLRNSPNGGRSQQLLNEVAAARACLLSGDAKEHYDRLLKRMQRDRERLASLPPPAVPGAPAMARAPAAVMPPPGPPVPPPPLAPPSSGRAFDGGFDAGVFAAGSLPAPLTFGAPPPMAPTSPVRTPTVPTPKIEPVKTRGEPAVGELDVAEVKRSIPAWLVSGVVHLILLIVLALWVKAVREEPAMTLTIMPVQDEGEQLIDDTPIVSLDPEESDLPDLSLTDIESELEPLAAAPEIPPLDIAALSLPPITAPTPGMALSGREITLRKNKLGQFGESGVTESAVELGLAWLERRQRPDGSWSLKGPYPDGAYSENVASATAMALLAFQGAGHTHMRGDPKYMKVVAKGWGFLLKAQDREGNFFRGGMQNHALYTQAQCTIAICELYGMTRDPKFREPAQRAVQYCIKAQDKRRGGWRYNPGMDSDTSVTGWFVMALQSALMASIDVPTSTLDNVRRYLDSVQYDSGARYAYQSTGRGPTPSMTAEGLLCRQYLGWPKNKQELLDGADYLLANPITWDSRNVYYWYYGTQVLHHLGGQRWRKWDTVMKKTLPAQQVKTGPERGSWDPGGDQYGAEGGRLFVTCLSIYMLEVYYRHLPIYAIGMGDRPEVEEPAEPRPESADEPPDAE